MADDPRGKIEQAQGKLKNLNTDEEVDEIKELLDEAMDGMTGLGGEPVMESSTTDDKVLGYTTYNLTLDDETAERIARMVEDDFRSKADVGADYGTLNVTKIKAPRKAVIRLREE